MMCRTMRYLYWFVFASIRVLMIDPDFCSLQQRSQTGWQQGKNVAHIFVQDLQNSGTVPKYFWATHDDTATSKTDSYIDIARIVNQSGRSRCCRLTIRQLFRVGAMATQRRGQIRITNTLSNCHIDF